MEKKKNKFKKQNTKSETNEIKNNNNHEDNIKCIILPSKNTTTQDTKSETNEIKNNETENNETENNEIKNNEENNKNIPNIKENEPKNKKNILNNIFEELDIVSNPIHGKYGKNQQIEQVMYNNEIIIEYFNE